MAHIITRQRKDGARYSVSVYDVETKRKRSLGTFLTWEEADHARQEAEENELLKRTSRATVAQAHQAVMTLRDYVYDESPQGYRSRAGIETSTWKNYESVLRKHILPSLGQMAVRDIRRDDVRGMIQLMVSRKVGAPTIQRARKVLSTVMSTLVDHDVIDTNPAFRVKTPPVRRTEKPIFQPDEVKALISSMPTEGARLFVTFLIETGVRLGEALEVRRADVNWRTGSVFISRAVSDVGGKLNQTGTGRFLVKVPKGKKSRSVGISKTLLEELIYFVDAHDVGPDDLIFSGANVLPEVEKAEVEEIKLTTELIVTLGVTEPDVRGYQYKHGTLSGYTKGKCRCSYCGQAMRDWGRNRRPRGKGKPRKNTPGNLTGHMSRHQWYKLWYQACLEAKIPYHVAPHSLRHSWATWMLKNGMDLHWVQQQLGHASITTTEGYLHRLNAEDNAGASIIEGMLA